MSRIILAGVMGTMMLAGCATGNRAYMDSALSNKAEPATVWNRPQEVGFDWGDDIQGEATQRCVLYFICWGAEDGSLFDGLAGAIGGIMGRPSSVSDPLVRAAAAVAVKGAPRADGIYVVSHETYKFDIFIYRSRSAQVKGKSLAVRKIGEVSQDRADKVRNLSAIGGGALLNMPAP